MHNYSGGTKSFAKALFPAIMAALERLKSENKKLEGENERLRRTADGVEDLHQKGVKGPISRKCRAFRRGIFSRETYLAHMG